MDANTLAQLVANLGVPVMIIIVMIIAAWKFAPKLLDAYKEGNKNLIDSINNLSYAFTSRIEKLENKVDDIQETVNEIKKETEN